MGGRPRRRHVGLEASTLPTLSGYESRRVSSEPSLLTLPLEPAETRSFSGRGCVSWELGDGGPPAPSQGRGKSGCEHQLLVLGCERLGSLSEASGRSSRRLVPQLLHPRSGSGPFPTHPFIRWGSEAWGALFARNPLVRVIPSAVTTRIDWGWGGCCISGFTFVLPPPPVHLLHRKVSLDS